MAWPDGPSGKAVAEALRVVEREVSHRGSPAAAARALQERFETEPALCWAVAEVLARERRRRPLQFEPEVARCLLAVGNNA